MEVITKKTGYEWSLEANIRLLNLGEYETYEGEYFLGKLTAAAFYERIAKCTVKPNSQPRKTPMYLEYRMYGLVPYNISPIQQGIQFGHAVVDYGRNVRDIKPFETYYNKWADKDKTFIILNGGTTNNNPEKFGSLNNHLYTLQFNGIKVQSFCEPDLGDQLTAICFLVDERVFNKTIYPDFVPETLPWSKKKPSEKQVSELDAKNRKNYEHWVEKIGGETNAFLREYLKPLRLA
jgi:hypothetical protein